MSFVYLSLQNRVYEKETAPKLNQAKEVTSHRIKLSADNDNHNVSPVPVCLEHLNLRHKNGQSERLSHASKTPRTLDGYREGGSKADSDIVLYDDNYVTYQEEAKDGSGASQGGPRDSTRAVTKSRDRTPYAKAVPGSKKRSGDRKHALSKQHQAT